MRFVGCQRGKGEKNRSNSAGSRLLPNAGSGERSRPTWPGPAWTLDGSAVGLGMARRTADVSRLVNRSTPAGSLLGSWSDGAGSIRRGGRLRQPRGVTSRLTSAVRRAVARPRNAELSARVTDPVQRVALFIRTGRILRMSPYFNPFHPEILVSQAKPDRSRRMQGVCHVNCS